MGGGKPVVIKFAASVLNSQRDLPLAVTEIYRYVRQGKKVVAIVSALDGETDRLRAAADDIGAGLRSKHSAGFAALGEAQATYALAIACDHVGLSPHVLEAKELHLTAEGDFNDAWPTGVCDAALSEALQKSEVAIVPGYVGVGPDERLVLLGRGGADLTTIVVAHALGAEEAIFLTDADGLFDRDPLTAERLPVEAAKRYHTIPWTEVRNKAPGLIQDKALQYAENNSVRLNVMAPGALAGSKVGAYSAEEKPYSPEAPNRVAVAGLGVVGEGAALKAIFAPRKFELVACLVSDKSKPRHRQIDPALVLSDAEQMFDQDPEILVDATSSGDVSRQLIEAALSRGISVSTANKQAICDHLPGLKEMAAKSGASFAYSASVGGGSPMVETVVRAAELGSVTEICAVLNGTVNFILSEVERGSSFEEAVVLAQRAGFAEADPSADLSGEDARAKGKILAHEAFGVDPVKVTIDAEPLDATRASDIVKAGGVWRQVTRITRSSDDTASILVRYEDVSDDPLFSTLTDEENALRVVVADAAAKNDNNTDHLDNDSKVSLTCRGRGAGRAPTVEALLADVADFIRAKTTLE